jgi:hypothetical protein
MSEAIMASIKSRAAADVLTAYKKERPERGVHGHSVSDVSVTPSFVGFVCSATLRVTTNVILFKNTTVHRVELIYGQDGGYRQLKSLVDVSEYGLSF